MNFVEKFLEGKKGENIGLPTGIRPLDKIINGLQRKVSIGVAAAAKVGKTTFVDFCFLLNPYLHMLKEDKLDDIEWIYFSFEIDRITKEFKLAAFFMANDFGIYDFRYKDKAYLMSQDYLEGTLIHDNGDGTTELVKITEEHEDILKHIYINRIVPMFGEYDKNGNKVKKGKIDFIEHVENPTGLNKYLFRYARDNGSFVEESYYVLDDNKKRVERKRIIGYKANNHKKYTIIITDHIRKLTRERGFTLKENIDKWLEYTTYLRNICGFTFININHSGRGLSNVDRLKYAGEYIFPTADDVKDSGNLGEESTYLITLFNPNDEKYNIDKHFGVTIKDYPNYRSIHLAESRKTISPQHIQSRMLGNINMFLPLENY